MAENYGAYPSSNIDPRKKGYAWILQYIKAAYNDARSSYGGNTLFFAQNKYEEIRQYALGQQTVSKYKKILGVEDVTDQSWQAINWTVPAFLSKYREIAISKLIQKEFNVECAAIDPIARTQEDDYFNQMKAKIMMREALQMQNSPLANHPAVAQQTGEAGDEEELQLEQEFSYKHAMAMEAEMAIHLIRQQNNGDEIEKRVITSNVDFGVGGTTTYIDENGMCKYREVVIDNLILSSCTKPDFSDLVHWGECIQVPIVDLVPFFDKKQIDDICMNVAGKYGNPYPYTVGLSGFNRLWNQFTVLVFQCKFYSWNETVFESRYDNRGNFRFGKTDYANRRFVDGMAGVTEYMQNDDGSEYDGYNPQVPNIPIQDQGEAKPIYQSSVKKVVYKGSWLVGTDYMYDFGLSENMVRKQSCWWDTSLDLQLYSWNFNKMQFGGLTERLIPLEDKACLLWFRLQNISNKVVPYLINLDLNQLEGINFGSGGDKLKPSEVMNFIFQNFAVPYRSTDLLRGNPNMKPVEIQDTGALSIFAQLYNELDNTINQMRQISGLNEATDGSTINAKNLNSTNAAMIEGTNNALYLIECSKKQWIKMWAESVVLKVQIAVKLGKVEGYYKALGSNTIKFLSINPDLSLHELGIDVYEAPTRQEREMLWQDVNLKESQGLLDVTDKALIMGTPNLKQAMKLLGYRLKKRKMELQQYEMQKQQMAIQQQTQGNMMLEAAKQQNLRDMGALEIEKINTEKQWEYIIEAMKKSADFDEAQVQAQAKVIGNEILGQAKIVSSHIAAESAKQKQEIANKKPKTSAA
jgi:hypothetical protein